MSRLAANFFGAGHTFAGLSLLHLKKVPFADDCLNFKHPIEIAKLWLKVSGAGARIA